MLPTCTILQESPIFFFSRSLTLLLLSDNLHLHLGRDASSVTCAGAWRWVMIKIGPCLPLHAVAVCRASFASRHRHKIFFSSLPRPPSYHKRTDTARARERRRWPCRMSVWYCDTYARFPGRAVSGHNLTAQAEAAAPIKLTTYGPHAACAALPPRQSADAASLRPPIRGYEVASLRCCRPANCQTSRQCSPVCTLRGPRTS